MLSFHAYAIAIFRLDWKFTRALTDWNQCLKRTSVLKDTLRKSAQLEESVLEPAMPVVLSVAEKATIRVLHVDDEASLLKVTQQCLEMEGSFQVDVATSVQEGFKKLEKKPFDVVISDYMMPEKDGLQFLQELRDSGNNIPFIIFTGRGREEVAIRALNLGADQYLHKAGAPETVYGELAYSITRAVQRKRAEERLRKSEELYRNLFELAPQSIITVDKNGVLTSCNNAATKMLGYSKEEMVGKHFSRIGVIRARNLPKFLKLFISVLKNSQSIKRPLELTFQRKDGSILTAEVSVSLLKQKGKVVGIQTISKDITKMKKAEESLEASEKALLESNLKFQALFMDNPEAAVFVGPHFRIRNVNSRFIQLFGYRLDELKGKSLLDVIVPEEKRREAESLDDNAKKGRVYSLDTIRTRKDGSLVQVSISAAPITVDGQLLGYVGLYRNISELKKAQQQLEESQRHFQTLFNLMVDPVAIVDEKGKILEVTDKALEITGFQREELVGRNFLRTKIATRKSKVIMMKNLAQRMMGKHFAPYEIEVLTKDGKKLPYEINAAKINYKGKPADLVVFRDVSERKNMEEKLRVVGGLARHDIRNKLAVVMGNIFLAKKLREKQSTLEHLEEIEATVRQIENILEFARTYERLGVEKLEYMDVEKTFGDVVTLFSNIQGIKVVNYCNGLSVLADSLLSQLFYILIDNSLKHGEKVGHIRLHFESSADQLRLIYDDDGCGIPPQEKTKIFKEEYRKESGHGLYLTRKMCEVYGWNIEETGKQGKGAQFAITIPKINGSGKESYRT